MKKLTIADKIAKKSFESDSFQKSWQVHMAVFGPILAPAFPENYQAKVHLAAALNRISRQDLQGGIDKLKEVQKHCETNADKAAWLFFMGLCLEMAGAKDQMLEMYLKANQLGHRFYMSYVKAARYAQEIGQLDVAEENYRGALACINPLECSDQEQTLEATIYCNLCSCLTMQHRLEEAQEAMTTSKVLRQQLPGRAAVDAILCAARKDPTGMEEKLAAVREETPAIYEATRKNAMEILAGTYPDFCNS